MNQGFVYSPIIKGKLNDIKAMAYVEHSLASQTKPLYELPPFLPTKKPEEELTRFVKRLAKMSGPRQCYVDFPMLKPGTRVETGESALMVGFALLKNAGVNFEPVYGFDRDEAELSTVVQWAQQQGGLLLRLDRDDLDFPDETIERIFELRAMGLDLRMLDLLVDHRYLGTEADALAAAANTCDFVDALTRFVSARAIIVAGSSSPKTVAEIERNSHGEVARQELTLWANVATQRLPANMVFGDYGVIHPDFSDLTPSTHINGKIRYTHGAKLHIHRGHSLRQGEKYEQYRRLAAAVVGSSYYQDRAFSYGDRYIYECATGHAGTGNPGTWVLVDQNHHISYTVKQAVRLRALATQGASIEELLEQS
ncbi:beta family protein [Burkholderia pseudomallei]|uniref:beta family protein n=1 Tax=Burkholderia pseudomallei TaxID=28450 RepID=UPI00053864B8|nr:beta family protein [Burkholderia pseudomallei]KGX36772.1 beta family protein [Burkholderia pseudomallei MSHR3335]